MKKRSRFLAVCLSVVLFFCAVPPVEVQATAIGTDHGDLVPGEIWRQIKNAISFSCTQLGVVFSGTAQDLVLNEAAFNEWYEDRYINGYDDTPWNAKEYYTKECVRNPDYTLTLSDRFMDDTYAYVKESLDKFAGYYLVPIQPYSSLLASEFYTDTSYKNFVKLFDEHDFISFGGEQSMQVPGEGYVSGFNYAVLDNCSFVFTNYAISSNTFQQFWTYDENWAPTEVQTFAFLDNDTSNPMHKSGNFYLGNVYAKSKITIKVFKNIDSMKNDDAGTQPYYAGEKFINYDASQDNSITVNENDLSSTNWDIINDNSYRNISTTIINNYPGGISAEELQKIIQTILDQLEQDNPTNPDPPGGGGGGSGTGGGGSGGSIGEGLGALMEGLGKLLDFVLQAVGKLIGVISDFLTKALGLLDGLSSFTGPFSDLLAELMPFVPKEMWDIIIAGITLSIIVMVIKAFKN